MQKLKCDMDNMVMFGWVSNLKKQTYSHCGIQANTGILNRKTLKNPQKLSKWPSCHNCYLTCTILTLYCKLLQFMATSAGPGGQYVGDGER